MVTRVLSKGFIHGYKSKEINWIEVGVNITTFLKVKVRKTKIILSIVSWYIVVLQEYFNNQSLN